MPTPCFLATETDENWQWLRRFTYSSLNTCPLRGIYGHDAKVEIERGPVKKDDKGFHVYQTEPDHSDPRWPKACECGYVFKDTDAWQLFTVPVYTGVYGECQIHSRTLDKPFLPGTLYDAWWLPHEGNRQYRRGPDGLCLAAICPDKQAWIIDGPSSQHRDQPAWTRTGTVPLITASPSIDTGTYHGHLTNGVFTDDCNGRRYT